MTVLTDEFVALLRTLTVIELAQLRRDFQRVPEDAIYLQAVEAEFKRRAVEGR